MRFVILVAALLVSAGEPCPAAPKPTSGQCRDVAGRFIACQVGAATDAEGVPLKEKARVIEKVGTMQTAAPVGVTAICRDRTYSTSKHHSRTCLHHGGVLRWLS